MSKNFQSSGFALSLYGAVSILSFVALYVFEMHGEQPVHGVVSTLIINVFVVVNFLAFLSGLYLVKQNQAAHKFAFPVSIIILVNIPFGTLAGAIYLWERFKNT